MKTAKKVLLFVMGLTIASMIIFISCQNRYLGPSDKGIFDEVNEENGGGGDGEDSGPIPFAGKGGGLVLASGYVLPQNSLSQEEQYDYYDPDFNSTVLFANGKIPALTVTKNGVILAAAGTGESANYILVKRSSDMGRTWTEVQANTSDGFNGMYTHPFFINGHDGSVLMGVATTNATENKTIIYKSVNDGASWTKESSIELTAVCSDATSDFVTFGQGLTLRHQSDGSQKLLFPYWYSNNNAKATSTKGRLTATMCSTDGGKNFTQLGSPYGSFTTYETKFIELSDGKILLNMIAEVGQMFWMISADCGTTWTIQTGSGKEGANGAKRTDFVRYEFNGKPIKNKDNDSGDKYALMIHSSGDNYGVKMSINDFNNGSPGSKYQVENTLLLDAMTTTKDGYPAITTLPDGTIATLTDEDNGVVFRRFNLYWLSDGLRNVDYSTDLKENFNN